MDLDITYILLRFRKGMIVEKLPFRSYFPHSPALVGTVIAFIANPDEGARAHVRVAYDAPAVAFLAQPPDRHARLLAAEDEIRVMLRHREARRGTKCEWQRWGINASRHRYGSV